MQEKELRLAKVICYCYVELKKYNVKRKPQLFTHIFIKKKKKEIWLITTC